MMLAAANVRTGQSSASHAGGGRTCVACGAKKDNDELVRVTVAPDGSPIVDWRGNLGGRGAHVCPSTGCLTQAMVGKKLGRSLKCEVRYGAANGLVLQLCTALERQLETLLRSGTGARRMAMGNDAALEAVGVGKAVLLLVANDSAGLERYGTLAAAAGVPLRRYLDKAQLGAQLGRVPTGVVAVLEPSLAKAIIRALDRRASFE
jgi:predicted RNA-binding protein YlxR (DUF448 family)